jgi:adenylate cyclase
MVAMLVGAGFLASLVSVYLVPVAVFAAALLILKRLHSASGTRKKLREKNDLCFLVGCRSGVSSQFRRMYRRVPTNPRCRFCLVPFGGVGRVLGFTPSRKNPNFCPG